MVDIGDELSRNVFWFNTNLMCPLTFEVQGGDFGKSIYHALQKFALLLPRSLMSYCVRYNHGQVNDSRERLDARGDIYRLNGSKTGSYLNLATQRALLVVCSTNVTHSGARRFL
jgi:hypothetical protein